MDPSSLKTSDFWESQDNVLLLNPKLPPADRVFFTQLYEARPETLCGQVFLASSGSSGVPKLLALSKKALLKAATATNAYLITQVRSCRWVLCLPIFHVSGLSILARAHLSGSPLEHYNRPWNAHNFSLFCEEHSGTLTSLVPTQIFDLVSEKIRAPKCLELVLVGGAQLDEELFQSALTLGWPLKRCYGMSESAAFFAVSEKDSIYSLLPHMQVKLNDQNEILLAGEALFSGQIELNPRKEPEWRALALDANGYWNSRDQGLLHPNGKLTFLGRNQDFVKILGERVSLEKIRRKYQELTLLPNGNFHVVAVENARRGKELVAVFENFKQPHEELQKILVELNKQLAPFEKLQKLVQLDQVPRSSLGKVLMEELASLVTHKLTLQEF